MFQDLPRKLKLHPKLPFLLDLIFKSYWPNLNLHETTHFIRLSKSPTFDFLSNQRFGSSVLYHFNRFLPIHRNILSHVVFSCYKQLLSNKSTLLCLFQQFWNIPALHALTFKQYDVQFNDCFIVTHKISLSYRNVSITNWLLFYVFSLFSYSSLFGTQILSHSKL